LWCEFGGGENIVWILCGIVLGAYDKEGILETIQDDEACFQYLY
jgi:hypothetical protein